MKGKNNHPPSHNICLFLLQTVGKASKILLPTFPMMPWNSMTAFVLPSLPIPIRDEGSS